MKLKWGEVGEIYCIALSFTECTNEQTNKISSCTRLKKEFYLSQYYTNIVDPILKGIT